MAARREISFSVAGGQVTEDEENYMLEKGLRWEDSKGEQFDISTDVEDSSFLNQSRQHSLILFEENEKLYYCETINGSSPDAGLVATPLNSKENVAEVVLPIVNPLTFDEDRSFDEDEDKENKIDAVVNPMEDSSTVGKNKNRLSTKSTELIESSGKTDRNSMDVSVNNEVLAEIPGVDERSPAASPILTLNISYNEMSLDESNGDVGVNPMEDSSTVGKNKNRLSTKGTELIESSDKIDRNSMEVPVNNEVLAEIPRVDERSSAASPILTLDISYNEMSFDESNVDVVPCTQNLSMDECERTGSSLSSGEYVDIVPCTQQEESIMEDSQLDFSNAPISQASAASSTREDLDDTITTMTKLLALADEQEAKEKMNATREATDENAVCVSGTAPVAIDDSYHHHRLSNIEEDKENSRTSSSRNGPNPDPNVTTELFKTPLKHARLKLLKRKHLYTPSPPRTHVDELLQKGQMKKSAVVVSQKSLKLALKEESPANTSTPKRNPLNNITPIRKIGTSTPKPKTPVTAKVDSGLRPPAFAIGLSPVANYIYSKPAPSTFARVTGIPNPNSKASNNAVGGVSTTRIPVPPSRPSQAKTATPGSSSKEPRTHSVLRTSTYFSNCTPPKIILNEKSDTKRFQPLKYTGTPNVKVVNGKLATPRDGYLAQRHTGLRDDSGNASFIQNAIIQKQNIPLQSRLVTPQSLSRKK